MRSLPPADKARVLDILCAAFDANKSVNFIAGPGEGREKRIRTLMDYSFEICRRFGQVHLSDDRSTCALILYPDRKRPSIAALRLDLKLVFQCIGLRRLTKSLRRESIIKRRHPKTPFTYLWFIGVDPGHQRKGSGEHMLQRILSESREPDRPVYLETSTMRNLPWYQRAGFEIYHEEDFATPCIFCGRKPEIILTPAMGRRMRKKKTRLRT